MLSILLQSSQGFSAYRNTDMSFLIPVLGFVAKAAFDLTDGVDEIADAAQKIAVSAAITAGSSQEIAAHAAAISAEVAVATASIKRIRVLFTTLALCAQIIAFVTVVMGIIHVEPKIRRRQS